MRYLPAIPLLVAAALALAVAGVEEPAQRDVLYGWIALLIGLSGVLSGIRALVRGRVLARSRYVLRDERPGIFWITVVVFRFGVAAIFFAVGLRLLR